MPCIARYVCRVGATTVTLLTIPKCTCYTSPADIWTEHCTSHFDLSVVVVAQAPCCEPTDLTYISRARARALSPMAASSSAMEVDEPEKFYIPDDFEGAAQREGTLDRTEHTCELCSGKYLQWFFADLHMRRRVPPHLCGSTTLGSTRLTSTNSINLGWAWAGLVGSCLRSAVGADWSRLNPP